MSRSTPASDGARPIRVRITGDLSSYAAAMTAATSAALEARDRRGPEGRDA